MKAKGIHHLGVAVADLDAAVATYERLFGAKLEHRARVEEQGVEAASLRIGDSRVELLSSLGEDTPVGRFLERRGEGMHHVAFGVDDIEAELAALRAGGATLIDEQTRQGLYGPVAFVHPETVGGVLVELVGRQGPSFSKEAQ